MNCPRCKLVNPPDAKRCDCGYDFETKTVDLPQTSDGPSDEELRAVFGRKADYYIAQWRRASRRRVNWAAFFMTTFWLSYRRMYGPVLIFFGAVFLVMFLEALIFRVWLGYQGLPYIWDRLGNLVPLVVCGTWGNRWYMSHTKALLERASNLPPEERLTQLSRWGGTKLLHGIVLPILLLLGLTFVVVVIDLALGFPIAGE